MPFVDPAWLGGSGQVVPKGDVQVVMAFLNNVELDAMFAAGVGVGGASGTGSRSFAAKPAASFRVMEDGSFLPTGDKLTLEGSITTLGSATFMSGWGESDMLLDIVLGGYDNQGEAGNCSGPITMKTTLSGQAVSYTRAQLGSRVAGAFNGDYAGFPTETAMVIRKVTMPAGYRQAYDSTLGGFFDDCGNDGTFFHLGVEQVLADGTSAYPGGELFMFSLDTKKKKNK